MRPCFAHNIRFRQQNQQKQSKCFLTKEETADAVNGVVHAVLDNLA